MTELPSFQWAIRFSRFYFFSIAFFRRFRAGVGVVLIVLIHSRHRIHSAEVRA
jgi:hypothetical protein